MDFVLGLPQTNKGRDRILLLWIDFRKWHNLYHVIKAMMLLMLLICSSVNYSLAWLPNTIVSDRDTKFLSHF